MNHATDSEKLLVGYRSTGYTSSATKRWHEDSNHVIMHSFGTNIIYKSHREIDYLNLSHPPPFVIYYRRFTAIFYFAYTKLSVFLFNVERKSRPSCASITVWRE